MMRCLIMEHRKPVGPGSATSAGLGIRCIAPLAIMFSCVLPAHALDLKQALTLALQNEPSWLAAQSSTAATRELEIQAKAQLLPNIQFSGSGSRVHLDETRNGAEQPSRNYNSHNLTLSLKQTLYRKPQFAQIDQSKAQVRQAEAEQERARRELLLRVVGAYFDALYADSALLALQSRLATADLLVQAARQSFSAGHGTRTDIDEAVARRDLAAAQSLKAKQQVSYAREQLAVLIGQPVDNLTPLDLAQFKATAPEGTVESWIARAEAASPDLQALQARVDAARQEVEKARGGHYPTLDLFAQGGNSQSESTLSVGSRYDTAQIGLQFNLPLYSGGGIDSAVRQALANLNREQHLLEQGRRTLALAVRKEYQNLSEGIAQIAALEQAAQSAAQMRIGVEKGIRAGTRTRVDLINAQQQETDVARELALARYQFLMAEYKLHTLAGTSPLDR